MRLDNQLGFSFLEILSEVIDIEIFKIPKIGRDEKIE